MVKVAGVWEQGWNTPILEYDLWAFPLRDFGIEEWYMTPVSGINKPVTEVALLQEVLDANLDLIPIYLDEHGETTLHDFTHPENALYILGKASYSPWRAAGRQGVSVRIETPVGGGMLWPHQCITLALYDRMLKQGRGAQ